MSKSLILMSRSIPFNVSSVANAIRVVTPPNVDAPLEQSNSSGTAEESTTVRKTLPGKTTLYSYPSYEPTPTLHYIRSADEANSLAGCLKG